LSIFFLILFLLCFIPNFQSFLFPSLSLHFICQYLSFFLKFILLKSFMLGPFLSSSFFLFSSVIFLIASFFILLTLFEGFNGFCFMFPLFFLYFMIFLIWIYPLSFQFICFLYFFLFLGFQFILVFIQENSKLFL